MYDQIQEIVREDVIFRSECSNILSPTFPASKPTKRVYKCKRCGHILVNLERLTFHMTSRNCKRPKSDDDESPEPHEAIGSNLKECLETYKKLKDKNFNDDKIL